MLLVLIVHADFLALGEPDNEALAYHPVSSFARFTIQALSLVCVNVFILISGYFGIKLKAASVKKFIFMVLFWRILILAAYLAFPSLWPAGMGFSKFALMKMVIPGYDDWFVASYILLMIFSPMLNCYIEKLSDKQLWNFAIGYILFQVIFAWFLNVYTAFAGGYSVLSFFGLYMLGAATRRSAVKLKRPATKGFAIYAAVSLLSGAAIFLTAHTFGAESTINSYAFNWFMAYNGIGVMIAGYALFFAFKHLSFSSRAINFIAGSAFAVYLFHMHPLMRKPYLDICRYLYNNYGTWEYIALISGFIIGVFALSIAIDLIRRWLWSIISSASLTTSPKNQL